MEEVQEQERFSTLIYGKRMGVQKLSYRYRTTPCRCEAAKILNLIKTRDC